MATEALFDDPVALRRCFVVHLRDPTEMDRRSLVSQRFPEASRVYKYRLRDRAVMRTRFDDPIFSLALGRIGDILISQAAERFATEVAIEGDARNEFYCFNMLFRGHLALTHKGSVTTAAGNTGFAMRAEAGVRYLTSDFNARANLFIRLADLQDALSRMLDDGVNEPLDFRTSVDWSKGLAASVRRQCDYLISELKRPDGLASNPVAVASMTDLLLSLVLQGVPHNFSDRLEARRSVGIPSHLRRAEDFMRANAAAPIRMAHVADAAGCSVRTLSDVFRQFRDTTPLRALHAIRLECAREALRHAGADASSADVARRYGFTNAGRFAKAYRQRFAEAPAATSRRATLPQTGISRDRFL